MMIKVLKISVTAANGGPDVLTIYVDMKDGCFPYKDNAYVTMKIARGTARKYCKENFLNVPIEFFNYK